MRVLVVYKTITGNTKKVAQKIYETLECEKELKNIYDVEKLEGYDLYFLGFPMLDLGPDKQTINFLKEKAKGKSVALFVTHGSPIGFHHLDDWLQKFKNAAAQTKLLGMFDCQGKISDAGEQFFIHSKVHDLEDLAHIKKQTIGHPNKADAKAAEEFVKKIMANVSK